MTARDHNKLLSIFFFIQGGLQLFGGLFAVIIYVGMGAALLSTGRGHEEQTVGGVFLGLAFVVGILILIFAGFYLLTGWKLHKEQQSARILGIIASCICLLGFPLGTALGIYGLWFFLGEQGKQFYSANSFDNPPPPRANSWQ